MLTADNNKRLAYRRFLDNITGFAIRLGGMSIILMVILIFVYLVYKAVPLFFPADVKEGQSLSLGISSDSYFGVDEYAEVIYYPSENAEVNFYDLQKAKSLPAFVVSEGKRLVAVRQVRQYPERFIWAFDDGTFSLVDHTFEVSYEGKVRQVMPVTQLPFEEPVELVALEDDTLENIVARDLEDELLVAVRHGGQLSLVRYDKQESMLSEGIELEENGRLSLSVKHPIDFLELSGDGRWLYAIALSGEATVFKIASEMELSVKSHSLSLLKDGSAKRITAVGWLLGDFSLLVGDDSGVVAQWFPVQQSEGALLPTQVRKFELGDAPIRKIISENQRKVFAAIDERGEVGVFYSSSGNKLLQFVVAEMAEGGFQNMVYALNGSVLFFVDQAGKWYRYKLDNPHPESSLTSLWSKVHYEGYHEPQYLWQSSASHHDFEPKLSLTPLLFGTLKAAFYAMLLAVPLAILGAIYTAFFMSARARRVVKPTVEIMEALPTVILGFLAGLWLAPMVEGHLLLLLLLVLLLPLGVLLGGLLMARLPFSVQQMIGLTNIENRALLALPLMVIIFLVCFYLTTPLEVLWFNGDFGHFVTNDLGITYNQRNALVVGFAMGFAVIPTIFSITEDAIYSVPKHLVLGSLALGSSPWQTLRGVVLPTASPGIFSALMIGFGRAVGETMIVLMATGNTPVMEWNIFEGMRTLAANIAIEMPESAVNSTHFRVLFMAALVLFLFTFCFNTLAEMVRHRLKRRYAEL